MEVLPAQPSPPFSIPLAKGGSTSVAHKNFVALEPADCKLLINALANTFPVVDLMLVTCLDCGESTGPL